MWKLSFLFIIPFRINTKQGQRLAYPEEMIKTIKEMIVANFILLVFSFLLLHKIIRELFENLFIICNCNLV
jgi:hypothetical protein